MKHTSVKMNTPCEFLNITPVNPLISKCQIKVCYVSDEPNRNKSVITKSVATEMASSLPGSPIVGTYNEAKGDFEEHNRAIEIANGEVKLVDRTRPYGFVDLNAKVWFQKFLDDGENEREYLMTEGYIWTGQYPESKRIIEKGNNQSMELSEDYLDATWTKDNNGKPQFFIINEAIISKLCILGEDCEPCFEGSSITEFSLTFENEFKEQLFSMMNELKDYLKEGGAKEVFTTYAVEIGDSLWSAIWSYVENKYPDPKCDYCSVYRIEGIYEESEQKFVILQDRADMKYYRLDFTLNDEFGFVPSESLVEVTKSYTPAEEPQFALEAVNEFETEYKQKKDEEKDKTDKSNSDNSDEKIEEEEKCPKCGKPLSECECEKEENEDKKKYNLEDVVEYADLKAQYDSLVEQHNALETNYNILVEEANGLREFKKNIEKQNKKAMIDQFYMLSDEDKADVIENIDTYSVEDIEAKLSVICVRNKVSFDLDENKGVKPITYSLTDEDDDDASMPAWVKSLCDTAKSM